MLKLLLLTLAFGILLASCEHNRDDESLYRILQREESDTGVINGFPYYDSLKRILVANVDTIFKFRNSRNLVFHSYSNGDTATIQEDEDSYQFYYNYPEKSEGQQFIKEVSLENMPEHLFPSVEAIFKKLKHDRIKGFDLRNDGTLWIFLKTYSKDDIEVYHTLIWTTIKTTYAGDFHKDTSIAPNWIYKIEVSEYRGW